ncbi:MAG: sugar ABC transporter permease [Victivallaceae bacterium]|nr:sugar ABC transporter permease [Victivallaceae bacterium]
MGNTALHRFRTHWAAYGLILLPLALVLLFEYQVIANGIVHAFYRWDGDTVEEFVGLRNLKMLLRDPEVYHSFYVIGIFVAANLVKMLLPIVAAVVLHHIVSERFGYIYRVLFVVPMIIPSMVVILVWKYFYEPNSGMLNEFLRLIGAIGPSDTIQWLADPGLTITSLVFYGFPWVGAFGVLIYLAGLQNISRDVYEAAEIDGAGPLRVFVSIEMPLITTQIRINLILMTISAIQSWENIYLFLGTGGGPDGAATVPGLLIFREAFSHGLFGYGCAIGMVVFLITLALTIFNNQLVRVRK